MKNQLLSPLALIVATLCHGACHRAESPAHEMPRQTGAAASPAPPPPPPEPTAEPKVRQATLEDRGVFSDLNARITLKCAPWLQEGPLLQVTRPGFPTAWLAAEGVVICEPSASLPSNQSAHTGTAATQDRDGDGIFDAVDILRGAKKAVVNGAVYKNTYHQLDFPGGDVPRTEGVCTDVIIRALRNAGWDLQELVASDIKARPQAYPMVKKPDANIDHRRVKTLLPYFQHAFFSLSAAHTDTAFPYLPGDVLFMDMTGDWEPEHMGIVSDTVGPSGFPLIINNWTDGTVTSEMDLLGKYRVTHRFRIAQPLDLEPTHSGLSGVLRRHGLSVPETARQVLLVTVPLWSSSGGTLARFARGESGEFTPLLPHIPVRIGAAGLGAGRGLHQKLQSTTTVKQEGDKRAPAGVFALGTAFGRAPSPPYGGSWPYRTVTARDFWIDDPKSPDYNRWITWNDTGALPWSAEKLTMYPLGLVVEHNTSDTIPGRGSAIFLHPWKDEHTPTVGCTALQEHDLQEVLAWLEPEAKPVIIQVADRVY